MSWLKKCLGKIVQGIKNIFKKKESQSRIGSFEIKDGEAFIDGRSIGTVLGIERIDFDDGAKLFERTNEPATLVCDLTWDDCKLENIFSTYLTDLPKRISVPTLIVSIYANQDYDAIGVDTSQLEETGIAHYFCMSTLSLDNFPEIEWIDDTASIIIPNAYLEEWSDGHWTWS